MKKFLVALLVVFFLRAAEIPKITASYQRKIGDILEARGDVEISTESGKIYADLLRLNIKTGDVELKGNVSLVYDGGFIAGKEAYYNINTGKMVFKDAWGWLKPGIFISGKEIKGESKKEFEFRGGWFTPCNQTCPLWEIKTKRGKYYVDDHLSAWGIVLKLKSIPILYIPYIYYPTAKKKRKTGFLMPKFGYSSNKGYYFGEDFYWAPADWFDLTLSFDYLSNLGYMGTGEYRYIINEGNYGKAIFSLLRYKTGDYDYLLRGGEVHNLGKGWKLNANMDLVSSYQFLWNLSTNYLRAVQRFFYSSAYLTKSWTGGSLVVKADEQRNFLGGRSGIFRHLPEINFTMTRKKIVGPLYFSQSFVGDYFQEQKKGKWYTLGRIIYKPALYLTLAPVPWATFDNSVNLHIGYYTDTKNGEKRTGEPLKLFTYSYSATLTGPIFYKIYNTPGWSYSPKFKHLIEPTITFTYSPGIGDFEKIISYDTYDYFPQASYFSFSLNNRVIAKRKIGKERTPVEIFSFSIGGSYYPHPESVYSPLGIKISHKFSSLDFNLRFNPNSQTSIYWLAQYDPYEKFFLYNSITLSIRPKDLPLFADLNYFTTKSTYEALTLVSNQMRFSGGFSIKPLGLDFRGVWDYDIENKKTRQYSLFATLNFQCLMFIFRFSYLPFRKEKYFFNISFSLPQVGVGIDRFGG